MKTIMLIALLAAAGCGGKKNEKSAENAETGSECAEAINKGMDAMTASLKTRGSNAEAPEALLGVLGKLRTTLTERCAQDKWSAQALTCYRAVTSQAELRACQSNLTQDQRTKLSAQLRQAMMSSMPQMPQGMGGHPPTLQGAGSGAPAATPGAVAPAGATAPAGSAAAPAGSAASGW